MNTRTRHLSLATLLALVGIFAALPATAANLVWYGGNGTWNNTTTSWGTNGTGFWGNDGATFSSTGGTVTVNDTVTANYIMFNNPTGTYTLNSGTINLANGATIWNSANGIAGVIGSVLSGNNVNVQGSQVGALSVLTFSGLNTFTGNLNVMGVTLNLRNRNSYTGTTTVSAGGALKIDFSQGAAFTTNLVNASSPLVLASNGSLSVTGSSGQSNSQTFASLSLNAGAATITTSTTGTGNKVLVNLGAITRNAGATLNLVQTGTLAADNGVVTSSLNDSYGLLSGLTVGGSDWATFTGTTIAALPTASYTSQNAVGSWAANQNITNGGAYTGTLLASSTIGSLRFNNASAGTVNLGANTLTVADGILVTSTAGAYASAITGGTLLGVGGLGGKDLIVIQNNTNAAGALTIASSIADNGGATALTKSGLGQLILSGSNSYSGGTFLNTGTLNINNNNALGTGSLALLAGVAIDNTSGSPVTLPGSNTVTLGSTGAHSGVTYLGSNSGYLSIGAGGITIAVTQTDTSYLANNSFSLTVNNGTLNLAGDISAPAGAVGTNYNAMLLKDGNGTLILSGSNNFLKAVALRSGTLGLANANALGGAGLTISYPGTSTPTLDNTSGAPLTLTSNPTLATATTFAFAGSQSLDYGSGTVTLNANPTTIINVITNTLKFGGTLTTFGSAYGFTKIGAGTLTLTGSSTYSGATIVTGGTLLLTGTSGVLGATSGITISGSGLMIVDDRNGPANANRITNTAGFSMGNGGAFQYVGSDTAGVNSSETIATTTLNTGVSKITVSYNGTNAATLTSTTGIARTANTGGIALINGVGLGNTSGTSNVAKFITTTAPTLVGTTSSTGINATVKNTKIVPYLLGEATVTTGGLGTMTGTANTFLTYTATTGMRPLNPTDEFRTSTINYTGTDNTYVSALTTATASASVNSLVLNGGDLAIANTTTLTNVSGALLFVTNNTIKPVGTTGLLGLAAGENIISVNSGVTGTISAGIVGTNTSGLSIYGPGILKLSGSGTYGGTTYVNTGATLVIGNNNALGNSSLQLNGGSFRTDGLAQTIRNTFITSGTQTIGGYGDLTLAGGAGIGPAVALNGNSTAFLTLANVGTTTISGTFSLNNAASGAYNNNGEGLSIGSSGNLVITGPIIDNNTANVPSGVGSVMTINFRGVGANVTINPTANNSYGANTANHNVMSNGGYNTLTLGGPGGAGALITPLGTGTIQSNDGRGVFFQAVTSGQVLNVGIQLGNSINNTGSMPFGFTGPNDMTLAGPLSFGTTGMIFPVLGTGVLTFSNTIALGNNNLNIAGPGSAVFSGANVITGTAGSLTKYGPGTLTLAGTNTLSGATTLNGGTVILDYSLTNSSRLTSGTSTTAALTLNGVNLQLKGGSASQTLGTTTAATALAAGQSKITRNGGSSTIDLRGIIRAAGGALDFESGIATTTSVNTLGMLAGWATVGGANWAVSGTTTAVTALGTYEAFAVAGGNRNISQTGVYALASTTTVNSLKLNTSAASQFLDIGATRTLTLTTGGLLFVGTDNYAITNGTLKSNVATTSDLIIHQYGTGALTIGSVIANGNGASTLTKGGSGKLILTGTNTYTGITYLNAGILQVDTGSNLGTGTLAFNGGTLQTTTGFSTSRAVTLGANGGTFQVDSGTMTQSGAITNVGTYSTLTKAGAGTLILSASNNYVGATTITNGTLQLGNASALGAPATNTTVYIGRSTSPVTVNGGTLDINGFNAAIGNFTLTDGSVTDSAGTGSLAAYSYTLQNGSVGAILTDMVTSVANGANPTTSINLYKTTAGTVVLSGNNSYTGNTNVADGVLQIGNGGNTGLLGGGNASLTGGGLVFNRGNAYTVANLITGAGAVTQSGLGTLELTANNSYTGATNLNAGTLQFATLGNLGAGTAVNFGGGTLKWGTGNTADISGRIVTLNAGGATFDTNGNDVIFANAIGTGGGGGLTKAGLGLLTLSGSNSYTGATLVNTGTLKLAAGASLANSIDITVVNGATFDAAAAPLTVGAGKALVNNGVFTGNLTVNGTLSGYGSVSGTVSGSGLVSPGNSPGIQTVGQVDPLANLGFAFEFTGTGSPLYGTATASRNDVLRITNTTTTPFSSALIASNTVSVYFNVASLTNTDKFNGGFYTDATSDFKASIQDATFNYYIKGGTHTFNTVNYYTLAEYNTTNSSAFSVTVSTLAETANFGGGPVNGYVTQFTVPEPSALALFALGGLALLRRRRCETV